MGKIIISQKRDNCIGCGACTSFASNTWSMNENDGKADLKGAEKKDDLMVAEIDETFLEENKQAADICPVKIIKIKGYND